MHFKLLYITAAVLFGIGTLFMRNTHPYRGTRGEKFESKQVRKRIGTVLFVAAAFMLGLAGMTQFMLSKD
jgi:hypothetical protein